MMIDLSIASNRRVLRATGTATGEDLVALRSLLLRQLRDDPVLVLNTTGLTAHDVVRSSPDLPDVVLASVRRARLLGGGIALVCDPPLEKMLADRAASWSVRCYPDAEAALAAVAEDAGRSPRRPASAPSAPRRSPGRPREEPPRSGTGDTPADGGPVGGAIG